MIERLAHEGRVFLSLMMILMTVWILLGAITVFSLTLTENTQPAILTVSTAAWRLAESRGIRPAFVAGHSLGEYNALHAAGVFGFGEGLRMVQRRGALMGQVTGGGMAAVIGMPVGFVGAAESKEALAADGRVPYVIVRGRLGGSAMAVAAINAIAQEAE